MHRNGKNDYLDRVGVLSDATVVCSNCLSSWVHLLGVDSILGVQVLNLTVGEDPTPEETSFHHYAHILARFSLGEVESLEEFYKSASTEICAETVDSRHLEIGKLYCVSFSERNSKYASLLCDEWLYWANWNQLTWGFDKKISVTETDQMRKNNPNPWSAKNIRKIRRFLPE